MIDLCRLLAAFSPGALRGVGEVEQFIEALLKAAEWSMPWSPPLSKSRETNILLVLRTLANIVQERTQLNSTQYSLVRPSISPTDITFLQGFEPDFRGAWAGPIHITGEDAASSFFNHFVQASNSLKLGQMRS